MIKRDYMMTMIEELAQFLGRLLFLKETKRYDIAAAEIDDFLARFLGSNAAALRALSHEELLATCVVDGSLDVNHAVALACMMKELGDLAAVADDAAGSCGCYTRSLMLMLEAYGDGTRALPLEVPERIDLVIERVGECDIPSILLRPLFRYFEICGFYADAEDLLYELIESGAPGAREEGVAFYERLLARTDAELANGDLPRDEVEEGLRGIRGEGEG
jgi:hypothetical protein